MYLLAQNVHGLRFTTPLKINKKFCHVKQPNKIYFLLIGHNFCTKKLPSKFEEPIFWIFECLVKIISKLLLFTEIHKLIWLSAY